jgi:peptidyl-prolyl cis-trans isomerase C
VTISAADVAFASAQQKAVAPDEPVDEAKLIEQLVDRQLIRAFLAAHKIEPIADELKQQITQAENLIQKSGEDPQKLLNKLGYTPERLKRELGLPIAWQVYARRTITHEQIKTYFEQHKQELDGTQLRGSQIFLKLPKQPTETEITAKKEKLVELRHDIQSGKLTFADAAKRNSEAPSKENGGDVGLFGWRGKLPLAVSKAAFSLKVNEISEPIVTPFGVHLIQVTERHPGEFSLEDVRPEISDQLSQQLWNTTVAKEREKAKIVIERK